MKPWRLVELVRLGRPRPIRPKQPWRARRLQVLRVLLKGRPTARPEQQVPAGTPRLQRNVRRFAFVARTPETRIANIDRDQRT